MVSRHCFIGARGVRKGAGKRPLTSAKQHFRPQWGPWIHPRVVATSTELNIQPRELGGELCNGCGLCIAECPAGAISEHTFSGLQCRSYRKGRGEDEPCGRKGELGYRLGAPGCVRKGSNPKNVRDTNRDFRTKRYLLGEWKWVRDMFVLFSTALAGQSD